jgi:hypothetical protein
VGDPVAPSPETVPAHASRGRVPGAAGEWVGGLIIGVSAALVVWAPTRPSFDAYGWLTWGHMTLHGGLDTNAAPSWKPLPYLFTLVEGVFGSGAAWRLWMFTAIAVSLAGLMWAGRLASRVSAAPAERRWAGWVAGLLAAIGLLCLRDELSYGYVHYVLSAQTDPMVVALLLGAINDRLDGRERTAFWLLVLAALGRPESWPFLALDGWWLWRARPGLRWVLAAVAVGIALLWFGIPALSSRSWFIAGDNALRSGAAPTGNRALGALGRFTGQLPWPLGLAALGMVVLGAWRRERLVLALAGAVVLWMAIEVGFALHGWPALGRYMFEASAVVIVLGAGFVGRLLAGPGPAGGGGAAGRRAVGRSVVAALALAVIGGTVAFAVARGSQARTDFAGQQARTRSIEALAATIGRLGGAARIRACGEAISDGLGTQTVLAYEIGENVNRIGYKVHQPGDPHNPIVVFTPRGSGWVVRSYRQRRASCRSLRAG